MRALQWRPPFLFVCNSNLARQSLSETRADNGLLACSVRLRFGDRCVLDKRPPVVATIGKRDSFWCSYLHKQYEDKGIVKRLIEASADVELGNLTLSQPRGGH